MNSQKLIGLLIASAIASGVGLLAAQDDPRLTYTQSIQAQAEIPAPAALPAPPRPVQGQNGLFATGWRTNGIAVNRSPFEQSEVRKAMASMKAAESADDKAEAKLKLKEALESEYDNRMDSYDKHIEDLEKELEAMRERLAKRRNAKSAMVDLKMRELIAEINGLGWPSGSTGSRFPSPTRVLNFGSSNFNATSPRATVITRPTNRRPSSRTERADETKDADPFE